MKRYIRELLTSPEKARCKQCTSHMNYHSSLSREDGYMRGDRFVCQNMYCKNTVYITKKHRKTFEKIKDKPFTTATSESGIKVQETISRVPVIVKTEPKVYVKPVDKENIVFHMTMKKITDKFYDIGNGRSYNPVTRELVDDTKVALVEDDDEHMINLNQIVYAR